MQAGTLGGIMVFSSFVDRGGGKGRRFVFSAGRIVFCCLALTMMSGADSIPAAEPGLIPLNIHEGNVQQPKTFETSSSCSTCHMNIYQQFSQSMHADSFTNPLFRKMYFDILLPRYEENKSLAGEMKDCIACHSPVTFLKKVGELPAEQQVSMKFSGVGCDFCHRVTGYKGPEPRNGNYIAEPGMQKFGPFRQQSEWHHAYAELQTKSEFCAICHSRINRFGLEIISTYSEWKESRYARQGIQCQDCHMNMMGFLTGGKPVFESGQASQNILAKSPVRDKLYTHRFPGAHSRSQIDGSIRLDIQVDESALVPGEELTINVIVDNSKSGHKLPTGTAELRMLYLDLVAEAGGRTISLPANSMNDGMFDVSGMGKFDKEILGENFPEGRRLYRAICVDPEGRQTQYTFDAEKIIFDNRLQADEIRKEFFLFSVPENIDHEFSLVANLYYLRYPESFAEKHGVEKAGPVKLASVSKRIVLSANAAEE